MKISTYVRTEFSWFPEGDGDNFQVNVNDGATVEVLMNGEEKMELTAEELDAVIALLQRARRLLR